MNLVTTSYIEECGRNRELREAVRRSTYPPMYAECYQHLLLDRPLFVQDAAVRRFADDLSAVFRMLVSLPTRLFDGDLDRYCAAVGIADPLKDLMTRGDDIGAPPLFGRSDAYFDGKDFKLLEFNIGTELGGMDFAEMNHALLEVPAFARFAEEHRLTYVDTANVVAGVLHEVARRVTDADRPVVVLLETTGGIAAHHNFLSVQEAMIARGLDFRLGEVQNLGVAHGKLTIDGTPIDVALRFFAAGEILEAAGGPGLLDPILRAHDQLKTVLFTGLGSSLYNTKGGLAHLTNDRFRDAFTPAERVIIDRVVPWTRMLNSSADPDLIDYCRAHRAELFIKPSVGWGAAGAVRGSETTDQTWSEVLTNRTDGGYVVQRVVTPALEPVWDPDEPEPQGWAANWGVFVTPHGYAGSFVRALKPADGTIVTFGNKGTRGTGVFAFESIQQTPR
jgi:hypothetical protein